MVKLKQGLSLFKNNFQKLMWSRLSLPERKKVLLPIVDILRKKEDIFVRTLIDEISMPKKEAIESHRNTIRRINIILESAKEFKLVQDYGSGIINKILRVPRGLVLLITPANHPISISLWQIIPALLAGNVVIYKPSEKANKSAKLIEDLFNELNFENGVFNVFYGSKKIVKYLINNLDLDLIVFTGSRAAGIEVNTLAAKKLIPTIMELGGKDSLIITESADLSSAVKATIIGCLRHSGQLCSSIERVYVHNSIWKKFISKLKEDLRDIKIGNPEDENTLLSKLMDSERYEFIRNQIKDAVKNGAELIYGSLSEKYYGPWLLINVPNDCSLFKEETLGPVISIRFYESNKILVSEVNDNDYGLCSTIWSSEKHDLAEQIKVGTVTTNRLSGTLSKSPWLGRKKAVLVLS